MIPELEEVVETRVEEHQDKDRWRTPVTVAVSIPLALGPAGAPSAKNPCGNELDLVFGCLYMCLAVLRQVVDVLIGPSIVNAARRLS